MRHLLASVGAEAEFRPPTAKSSPAAQPVFRWRGAVRRGTFEKIDPVGPRWIDLLRRERA